MQERRGVHFDEIAARVSLHALRRQTSAIGSRTQQNLSFVNYQLSLFLDQMAPEAPVTSLVTENRERARIFSASIKTAQAKGLQRPNDK
jgi:hypothetical protein